MLSDVGRSDSSDEWRVPRRATVGVCLLISLLAVLGIGMAIAAVAEGDGGAAVALAILFVVAPMVTAILYVRRCKVVCTPDSLEIVNVIRRREVGWHEIAHAEPGSTEWSSS